MRLDAEPRVVVAGDAQKFGQAFGGDASRILARLVAVDDAGQDEDRPDPGGIGKGQHGLQIAGIGLKRAGTGEIAVAKVISEQMVVIRNRDPERLHPRRRRLRSDRIAALSSADR